MRQVTIYTADQDYNKFMELIRNNPYVQKIEVDDSSTKDEIIENLKRGFEEVKLFKQGKLKTISAQQFLDEL